jgi:hypothetical protein
LFNFNTNGDGICDIDHIHGKWAVVTSFQQIVTELISDDDDIYAQVCSEFGNASSKTTMSTDMVKVPSLAGPWLDYVCTCFMAFSFCFCTATI